MRTLLRSGSALLLLGLLSLTAGCDDDGLTLFTFEVDVTTKGDQHLEIEGDPICSTPVPDDAVQGFAASGEFTIDLDDEGEFSSRSLDFITKIFVTHLELRVDQSYSTDPSNEDNPGDEDGQGDNFDYLSSVEVEVIDPDDASNTEVVATASRPYSSHTPGSPDQDQIIFTTPGPNLRDFIDSGNRITFRITLNADGCPPDDVFFHVDDGTTDGGLTLEIGAGVRND